MTLVLLANPDHPRVSSMQAARQQRGCPPAIVVSYADWLSHPESLLQHLDKPCWLKLEAWGEHASVHQRLINLGATVLAQPLPQALQYGELAYGHYAAAGFHWVLQQLEGPLQQRPWVRCVNTPATIRLMSDKLACQQHLQRHKIAIPPLLGELSDIEQLLQLLRQQPRLFIKPRFGSSAAGVIALASNGKGQLVAHCAIAQQYGRLFNSLKIQRYRDKAVLTLIEQLIPQPLYAEAWLTKPRIGRQHFDLRMLQINAQAAHRIARVASSPMTNLHLGNQRLPVDHCLSPPLITRAEQLTRQVASCFPGSKVAGIDMIISPRHQVVLEVNAFGDWLQQVSWQGMSVHHYQLAEVFR